MLKMLLFSNKNHQQYSFSELLCQIPKKKCVFPIVNFDKFFPKNSLEIIIPRMLHVGNFSKNLGVGAQIWDKNIYIFFDFFLHFLCPG